MFLFLPKKNVKMSMSSREPHGVNTKLFIVSFLRRATRTALRFKDLLCFYILFYLMAVYSYKTHWQFEK